MTTNNGNGAATVLYHFALEAENRDTVRQQGSAINRALKRLKKISEPVLPAQKIERDEPTQQIVTLPAVSAIDHRLQIALETADAERRKTDIPPAPKTGVTRKKKRWFRWPD